MEEVDDRLEELEGTISRLKEQVDNKQLFQIGISSYCEENAKIFKLIYQFLSVRTIRDNQENMGKLEAQKKKIAELDKEAKEIVAQNNQTDFFMKQLEIQYIKYRIK